MGSEYLDCPCCGMPTVVNDMDVPELCSECDDHGCECDGSDPVCGWMNDGPEEESE